MKREGGCEVDEDRKKKSFATTPTSNIYGSHDCYDRKKEEKNPM
jgi:hypothetical protein